MDRPLYHLHLDAAHLPSELQTRMLNEGGFHLDDFPHQLTVDGKSVPARHLTKYLYAPISSQEVKSECRKIKKWIEETSFKGLMQCEFVMKESHWRGESSLEAPLTAPLSFEPRSLSSEKGEKFKKHEMHLEVNKLKTSPRMIQALRECGFHILENESSISFTACGHSKDLLKIRRALRRFMQIHKNEITAKLTYEATAFWSLHGVEPETLPKIADSIVLN